MADTDLENIEKLIQRFKRPIPQTEEYTVRLVEEFELILNQRFTDYFLQICDIIDLTQDLTHMTRGSAGSSLVCYLLGITDVDPVKWQIPVARFMNPMRDDLPDVDIDFEHHRQLEVMNRIFKKWPGKTARLSNYVMYRQKSARKEAAKRLGIKGNLPRNFKYEDYDIDPKEAKRIENRLIGKKRAISKHCGGIVMFTRQLPKSLISQDNQILLDKHEVEDLEHLKVDILANRGLSQLLEIDPHTALADYPEEDQKTSELLCRGDILGVTQGESPAMRRLFRAIQPTSVHDCVFATAMVRPVAMSGRQKAAMFQDWSQEAIQDSIVFEDDAILDKNFVDEINQIMNENINLNNKKLIFLGGADNKINFSQLVTKKIIFENPIATTEGYITDVNACEERIKSLRNIIISLPIDHLLKKIDLENKIKQYWSLKPLVEQGSVIGKFE